jgi:hypothetical protein
MAVFNRTLYDLNGKRYYISDKPDVRMPLETILDLKLSVPNFSNQPVLEGIYISNNIVRILFSDNGRPVASYNSDNGSGIRLGIPLSLKSLAEGYAGYIVLGEGIRQSFTEKCSFTISEECLTRFRPSRIPFAGRPCTDVRLTGEVHISAGTKDAQSTIEDVSYSAALQSFRTEKALVLSLKNTEEKDISNPFIAFANGINRLAFVYDTRAPIYRIGDMVPDCLGNIHFQFSNQFVIGGLTAAGSEEDADGEAGEEAGEENEKKINGLAVGVIVTETAICSGKSPLLEDLDADVCPPGSYQLQVVP